MSTQRQEWIDALKCFLIIIVIWGHLIQYYSGISKFWERPIWEMIYSFHMPLFIFISGYLFKNKSHLSQALKTKAIQLLLPGLTCAIIIYLKDMEIGKVQLIDIKHIFESAFLNLWYLKALFGCILGGYLFYRFKMSCIITVIIFWLFIRLGLYEYIEVNLINLLFTAIGGGDGLLFLLPFFITGYCLKHYDIYMRIQKNIYLILLFVTWCILIQKFNGLDTIYFASPKWISNNAILYPEIARTFFRDFIALFAILFLFISFKKYYHTIHINSAIRKIIAIIGKNTLGIYILQYLIVEKNCFNIPFHTICQNELLCIIPSIFIVLILNEITKYIRTHKILSNILIGG